MAVVSVPVLSCWPFVHPGSRGGLGSCPFGISPCLYTTESSGLVLFLIFICFFRSQGLQSWHWGFEVYSGPHHHFTPPLMPAGFRSRLPSVVCVLTNECSREHMPLATYKMVQLASHRLVQRPSCPTKAGLFRRGPYGFFALQTFEVRCEHLNCPRHVLTT
jgi:hypothetical protein